jgi:cyclic beta-1,2-glucan synthetase
MEQRSSREHVTAEPAAWARSHDISTSAPVAPSPLVALEERQKLVAHAHERFREQVESERDISHAAEWVLDNYYVIYQAFRQVKEDLPAGYYGRLPKLSQGDLAGYPRIYALARQMVVHTEGRLGRDNIVAMVRAYQQVQSLTMGELWALPTMLRVTLLEFLAESLAAEEDLERPEIPGGIPQELAQDGTIREFMIARYVPSLNTLDAIDWDAFFEAVSLVEKALCEDPDDSYGIMEFKSRDRYREVIEELADDSDADEQAVAQAAVTLAQAAKEDGRPRRETHVGYYLIDDGRSRLEDEVGFQVSVKERLLRACGRNKLFLYLGSITLLTLIVGAGLLIYAARREASVAQLVVLALVSVIPSMGLAVSLVNLFLTRTRSPRLLPKLDYSDGVPESASTIVVIPALLSNDEEVDSLLQQIEIHYLVSRDPNLSYALLTDCPDAPEETMPADEKLVRSAMLGIEALNARYSREGADPFYLLHRKRLWNPAENCWMGWERKRGKLHELNRLLRGAEDTTYTHIVGDIDRLAHVRYVITLDADTVLPPDSASRMIGTLDHPLNRPLFSDDGRRVENGYTILQPRTEVKPATANRSPFTDIFSGDIGIDLYTRAVSDPYQDLFGEGIFVGKGIYDVDAFTRSLDGRVPENALLSHDLFEGIHGRAGLVTDVLLYEDYPSTYLAYAHRLHRWVRGDWQILPWLWGRVSSSNSQAGANGLSALDRWKILDNLRRSLHQPMTLLMLALGWLWFAGSPVFWTLVPLALSGLSPVLGFVEAIVAGALDTEETPVLPMTKRQVLRWGLSVILMPYEALLMLDAIATTLVRLYITHRRMLQWTTAAHTMRLFGSQRHVAVTWARMGAASVLSLGLSVLIALIRPVVLSVSMPFILLWVFSPQITFWLARPHRLEQETLDEDEVEELRRHARRTWLFFETFVGPGDHWLPPDHFQEDPRGLVAHRTSPTNIGLLLLSTMVAYELGYIGTMELELRIDSTLGTLKEMEHHRGHLLNWYDTQSLDPLEPRYVSTVDSGNLAASLLVVKQGLIELRQAPVLRWQEAHGLLDTLGVLNEVVARARSATSAKDTASLSDVLEQVRQDIEEAHDDPALWGDLVGRLASDLWPTVEERLRSLIDKDGSRMGPDVLGDLRIWADRAQHHVRNMEQELSTIMPWIPMLPKAPDELRQSPDDELVAMWEALLAELPSICSLEDLVRCSTRAGERLQTLTKALSHRNGSSDAWSKSIDWCEQLQEGLQTSERIVRGLVNDAHTLAEQAERMFDAMSFDFLYNHQREVFYLGYNVSNERIDEAHYDLLASEARIASLVAICKGEVPASHWLHLSRPMTRVDGLRMLLSWNGSMFEYLMPILFMRNYPGMLLAQTYEAVIRFQIAYGEANHVPWGISESGYYHFDADRNYQYRGFGVPGTGRKRGLADDLVISPYASMLALPIRPRAVIRNIDHLKRERMLGRFGFYEAIDYTQSRLPLGRKSARVLSFMSHHAGMTLVAMANTLCDGAIVERFHRVPLIQSVDLLLQERVPVEAPLQEAQGSSAGSVRVTGNGVELEPWDEEPESDWLATAPSVQYLSNGRYGVLITSNGGGYSSWRDEKEGTGGESLALTRWRADSSLDDWGQWVVVQNVDDGQVWSLTRQPLDKKSESHCRFYPHMVEFHTRQGDLAGLMHVVVSPDDDIEVRRITLTNHGDEPRRIRVMSYAEPTLAPQGGDRRHPAFNKLFIESEWLPERQAQLLSRRQRSADEKPIFMGHGLLRSSTDDAGCRWMDVQCEGDRKRFLGRGNTIRQATALATADGALSGSEGSTLDPLLCIGQTLEIDGHAHCSLYYLTAAAGSRDELLSILDKHADEHVLESVFTRVATQSSDELAALGIKSEDVARYQRLLSALQYPDRGLRAEDDVLMANRYGQRHLWPYDISGDYPVLLVRVEKMADSALVRDLLRAHTYWRQRGLMIDLVILNDKPSGYASELDQHLRRLVSRTDGNHWLNRRGGIFILRSDQMAEGEETLLLSVARVILDASLGPLDADEGSWAESRRERIAARMRRASLPALQPVRALDQVPETQPVPRPEGLDLESGYGGLASDGGAEYAEYCVVLEDGRWTPAPWVNVIANPGFGFLVSELGSSFTWATNSGENRLTPWHNDPVSDESGEGLYLRDEETAEVWSPTPLPAGVETRYVVRHGAGTSSFAHRSHGLEQHLRLCVSPEDPVKIVSLRLTNLWDRTRRLTATYYAEWVLGVARDDTQQYILPYYEPDEQALLARNPYNEEFGEAVAFLASSDNVHGLTTDRTEFLGRCGSRRSPAALGRIGLSGRVEPGRDPCGVLQVHLDIPPHAECEIHFVLGQGADYEAALELARTYRQPERAAAVWDETRCHWDEILGAVQVDTPDDALNGLLNRWSLYQALSCRIWGRSGFYQSSGAFGYRDQLQDVMALLHTRPDLARGHILNAATHQFEAGDVLHWWHPPSGRGVRTRITDDLLWLPFVTAEYVQVTGDASILNETAPFVQGEPLEEGEEENYGHWEKTEQEYSLYEHCRRALSEGTTSGPHELPLIGTGDWNDGLDRVGQDGRGESVWLAWFLASALERFAPLAELQGDDEQAQGYRQRATALRHRVNEVAWDGEWYLRAFYDNGQPLGSVANDECQIDSLPQSWSVLWRGDDPLTQDLQGERSRIALEAAVRRLVRHEEQLALLFAPPFDETPQNPGYIKGYPPGVRENGGQYTHAAIWFAWAIADLGRADLAYDMFSFINPLRRVTPEIVEEYAVEPYAVAADIYGVPPHTGRGGWTWYTGSAAWLYRLGLERLLGVQRRGDVLRMVPCIPAEWEGYRVIYRYGESEYHITVRNPDGVSTGTTSVSVDDQEIDDDGIRLVDDGQTHNVEVRLEQQTEDSRSRADTYSSRE